MSYFVKLSKNGMMQYYKIVFLGLEYEILLKIVFFDNKIFMLYVWYVQRLIWEDYNFSVLVFDYSFCNRIRENCSLDFFIVIFFEVVIGYSGLYYVGIVYEVFYN